MKRRKFLTTSAIAASCVVASQNTRAADETSEEVIDIHQHVNFLVRPNDVMLRHQEAMGVDKSILLPAGSPFNRESTLNGKGNGLQADVLGTAAAAKFVQEHPDRYAFFCNEVPDADDAVQKMEGWLERGAIGIGELKFHLEIDSPPMLRVYEVAKAYQVPVLMHFQYRTFNLGFERFYKVLEMFPTVNFIGHAQTWWANINAGQDQSDLYPKTKVTPGGITDQYLKDYPNMFGDLSAGSGLNAMMRDEEHASDFLNRHHKKLFFGTDCADHVGTGEACSGSQQLAMVRKHVTDPAKREAILSGNAKRVIF